MTSTGCVSQREGTYEGVTYADQRHLLDQLMLASGLPAVYENEPAIRGLLYLIDLDDSPRPVTPADLASYGIL